MAHKFKLRGQLTPSIPLPDRIDKARREGRFQQALELSRQLYKQDPTEQSLDLLRQVTFERAQQLQCQGHQKEASQTFSNIVDMGGSAEFQRRVIEKLAECGSIAEALHMVERLGDSQLRANVVGLAADHAVQRQSDSLLPADLRPQLDAVLQAFSQAEAGKDIEARQTLQSIGLASPFLEWRILLRGLLAYYANDDARALENWQRLNPQRLPSRLAAPFRLGIDQGFRAAQTPAAQSLLRQQLDRLQGAGPLPALRTVQAQLVHKGKMAQAFRSVEGLLPTLRQQAPHLLPRLAACFRWAVIDHGQEEDVARYLRVFGPLPDDRQLRRMAALALERNGMFALAHHCWQLFEKEVAETASVWPGDQARHVRALIWSHLGTMAAENAAGEYDDVFTPFGRPPRRQPEFRPSAEECFRKSLELSPESLPTHLALFQYLLRKPEAEPIFAAGTKLLEHFPDHVETLRTLGGMCVEALRFDDARDYLQRAMNANPLERGLRMQLSKVHEMRCREFSCEKRFDEARAAFQAALALFDFPSKYPLHCLNAVIELKAKNRPRYEALIAEAEKDAAHRLLVAYSLMCESIRQKLTPAQKKPFAQEVQTALAATVDPAVIPPLLGLVMNQRLAGPAYSGQKTHEKKVLALVEKAPLKLYQEEIVEGICETLQSLNAGKTLMRCVQQARKLFPANPLLMLIEGEVRLLAGRRGAEYYCSLLLKDARKLIEEMPRGDRQQRLQQRLRDVDEQLREIDGLHGFMSRIIDIFDSRDEDDQS